MPQQLRTTFAPSQSAHPRNERARGHAVLVWDSGNSSSLLVARAFARQGWAVDWLGSAQSPFAAAGVWRNRTVVNPNDDSLLERVLTQHPLDALTLHGDDQIRWVLRHWNRLPERTRTHFPPSQSLETALSKSASMQVARDVCVPVLDTVVCHSRAEVAAAAEKLGTRGEVVLKGEGGSAGNRVRSVAAGREPRDADWKAVTHHAPTVLVQRRIHGPRFLVTVAYERGRERSSCVHQKLVTAPYAFGPAAFGVTRRLDTLHDYAARMFEALQWHGIADIEFRQDAGDGRWYFMEINPRVCATLGIEAEAGLDLVDDWARACAGDREHEPPGRNYRDGVRYAWATRAIALWARRPWNMPLWGPGCLFSEASDFHVMDDTMRRQAVRTGLWIARHE